MGKKDYDAAILEYTKAINLSAKFADGYYKRGLAYIEKADYESAVRDLTKYIEIEPGLSGTYRHRASMYDRIGQKDLADADRRTAKEKSLVK